MLWRQQIRRRANGEGRRWKFWFIKFLSIFVAASFFCFYLLISPTLTHSRLDVLPEPGTNVPYKAPKKWLVESSALGKKGVAMVDLFPRTRRQKYISPHRSISNDVSRHFYGRPNQILTRQFLIISPAQVFKCLLTPVSQLGFRKRVWAITGWQMVFLRDI